MREIIPFFGGFLVGAIMLFIVMGDRITEVQNKVFNREPIRVKKDFYICNKAEFAEIKK